MFRQSEPPVPPDQYDERQKQFCYSKQGSVAAMSGRELQKYVDQRYGHPDIIVTENGVDVPGEASLPLPDALHDTFRISYTQAYLDQVSTSVPLLQSCAWQKSTWQKYKRTMALLFGIVMGVSLPRSPAVLVRMV